MIYFLIFGLSLMVVNLLSKEKERSIVLWRSFILFWIILMVLSFTVDFNKIMVF